MAYSSVSYTGDGIVTDFNIVFSDEPGVASKPYLAQTHIIVKLDGVTQTLGTDYTIDETTTPKIVFGAAPTSGQSISISRSTPVGVADRPVVFTDASMLRAASLNTAHLQQLYISQENLERFEADIYSVVEFGADPTGASDSTAAIQAALDNHSSIYFPAGEYIFSGIEIDGDNVSIHAADAKLSNNGTSALFVLASNSAITNLRFMAREIECDSSSGHVFDIQGSVSYSTFDVHQVTQSDTDKAIFNARGNGSAAFFSNILTGSLWEITGSHTVAAIDLSGSSQDFSKNVFSDLTCKNSGDYFFKFEDTGGASYVIGNTLESVVGSAVNGGFVKAVACANLSLNNILLTGMGTITNHLFFIGNDGASSLDSVSTFFNKCARVNGTLSGVEDVYLDAATRTTFIHCGSHIAGPGCSIDLNTQAQVFLFGVYNTAIANIGANSLIAPSTGDVYLDKLNLGEEIIVDERAAHVTTPGAGYGIIWMRSSDGVLIFTDAAGTDHDLTSGGGGVTSVNGNTGVVVLDADDLADGATNVMMLATERTKLTGVATGADVSPVASVNGKTGTVITQAWESAETDTGKTGIGGTPIYTKAFSGITVVASGGTTTVAHGVSPLLTKPVEIHLTYNDGTNAYYGSLPFSGTIRIYAKVDATNISVVSSGALPSGWTAQVRLEYQKT
jgi:hypothetical protein